MRDRIRFWLGRLRERLWLRPLGASLLSVGAALLAGGADRYGLEQDVLSIAPASLESLLSIMASSMLVIAIFSVTSMVAAYASASTAATPRSFPLVLADDVSQNALSTFLGAFIFSIVALVGVQNGYFAAPGRFVLFVLTVGILAAVVLTFVRWVDSVARLGRLGETIDRIEAATAAAIERRRGHPTLGAVPAPEAASGGAAVFAAGVGYVQRVDVAALQAFAEQAGMRVRVAALPGTFATPDRPLAHVVSDSGVPARFDTGPVIRAFRIGRARVFDDDPRFGLVVMAETAARALSPAVNDPGTAIDITGRLVRLLLRWGEPTSEPAPLPEWDRVEVPALAVRDLFDDAFTAIARDGAGIIEVMTRLQKALASLACAGSQEMRQAAVAHARLAVARAERASMLPADLEVVRALARFADG
ncbi:MAG: DUF2254 domain-containing protein [Vicinamibacterales bacterium]